MIRKFLRDRRGNFAMMTGLAMVPIMGALALAVDYSEMSRERQLMINALDASGIATARQLLAGAKDADLKIYAKDFFEANLGTVDPVDTTLTVVLPEDNVGSGTLRVCSNLEYHPDFLPAFHALIGKQTQQIDFDACTEVQLQNTLEVALVLDNSGSMDEKGPGATGTRMELLKEAAAELVETFSLRAQSMKQVEAPVQFSLVPFAASVNVGSGNIGESWMDAQGISPVHHENFDWATMAVGGTNPLTCTKCTELLAGIRYARGTNWGALKDKKLTRFTLFDETKYYTNGAQTQTDNLVDWAGCVEARPHPLNIDDTEPMAYSNGVNQVFGDPATLFVPMFAPDEAGEVWTGGGINNSELNFYHAPNSWWNDATSEAGTAAFRQGSMMKYFAIRPYNKSTPAGMGPNYSCTTTAITPLADLSDEDEKEALLTAIDNMSPLGATNVPEGMAWGWRVLSSNEPFTTGRPETDKGNDKVVIVLTDGANTYYTPSSLGYWDSADNKSTYSAFGYARMILNTALTGRIFQGAPSGVNKTDYSNANYTTAMNYLFQNDDAAAETLCKNVRDDGVIIITVSLDLDATKPVEKTQMDVLRKCASESRYTSGKILYYNATSKNLKEIFEEIAKELSNLRIVG